MRILADENFHGDIVTGLRDRGHDVAWVRTVAPGSSDRQVLERAQSENRILVTFDKDFGNWLFAGVYQHTAASSFSVLVLRRLLG